MSKVRKGYKDTEVGIIPDNWDVFSVGDITDVITGGTPSTLIDSYWGGEYKWMSSGELNNKFISDVEGRITELGLNNSSTRMLPINCILIGLAGQGKTRGTVAINLCELCTNQSIGAILPQNSFSPLYVYYNLNNRYNELRTKSTGEGGRGGLNKKILLSLSIPFPPIKEQQAIAKALSDIDALINTLNKQIDKKKNIKQGAMLELLTGKKRLQGFTEEWEEKTLGDVSSIIMGQSPLSIHYNTENQGLPLIQGNADIENRRTISRIYTSETTKRCNERDIILSVRAPVGSVARASSVACIGRGVCAIKTDNDFLYHYLVFVENDWSKYSKGSTFDSISSNELKNIVLSSPSTKEEQTTIAQILTDMDNEIEQLEKKRDKYLNIKSGMMQQLLTGQIRLTNAAVYSGSKEIKIGNQSSNKKKHSKQFDEAVIISFLVNEFGTVEEPLSRFMYTKLSYLIHRKHDCKVVDFKKFAAGPYNPKSRYGGSENIGKEKKYFDLVKDAKGYDAFAPMENIQEAVDYFTQWYGSDIQNWVQRFRQYKPWDLETLATVDMAVYDLREKGIESTVASVKTYLSSIPKWQAKLNKPHFSDRHIQYAIDESIRLFKI